MSIALACQYIGIWATQTFWQAQENALSLAAHVFKGHFYSRHSFNLNISTRSLVIHNILLVVYTFSLYVAPNWTGLSNTRIVAFSRILTWF